jgi:multidrug transporter EmrE-like cation transporter
MSFIYVAITILLTVYGQIVVKWQAGKAGALPSGLGEKVIFLLRLALLNPWMLSGLFAAFLASLAWMAAMTKLPLSLAYPFMSLSFVLVVVLGGMLFNEPITLLKLIGLGLIVSGVVVGSQG